MTASKFRQIIASIMLLWTFTATAQETEYKYEFGGGIGGTAYLGDADGKITKNLQPMASFVMRRVLNPHMAIKANLLVGGVKGSTEKQDQFYPEGNLVSSTTAATKFSRTVYDLGAQFEYNFWGYGTGEGFKGTRRLTPYILGGLGFTMSPHKDANVFTLNFPIGIGAKYKLKERVNVGAELTVRYTLSDKLDTTGKEGLQLNDPYGIKSSTLKNKDGYSVVMFFVTYDFGPKYRKCNN
ncbi:MAG: hypothetical protein IKR18_02875 [Bacteroidaceae bacterium]|nr:hypothetical protein [Bacteroidaceae bacterium]